MHKTELDNELFDVNALHDAMIEQSKEDIRKDIINAIDRSNELNKYVGVNMDPAVLNVLKRSLKIKINKEPIKLDIDFKDDLSHWYGGDLPDEFLQILSNIVTKALR